MTTTVEVTNERMAQLIVSSIPDSDFSVVGRDVLEESFDTGSINASMFGGFKARAKFFTPEQREWLLNLPSPTYTPHHVQPLPEWAQKIGAMISEGSGFTFTDLFIYRGNEVLDEPGNCIYAFFAPNGGEVESEYGIAVLRSHIRFTEVSVIIPPYVPKRIYAAENHLYMLKGSLDVTQP